MSSLLISQEKILEFLKNELSKIKAESAKQKDNKKHSMLKSLINYEHLEE